ncbi:hypothetical protein DIPPA_18870 [Diplonema papillatum]|nr:hypothetical protein DIPPA_18870 [Diplonema papillatum]
MTAGDYSTTTQQSTAGPTAPLMPPTVPTSMPPVMQPTPGMQTTSQHTAIESSAFGPATYVGGAPAAVGSLEEPDAGQGPQGDDRVQSGAEEGEAGASGKSTGQAVSA